MIYDNILETIGKTPIVRLNRIAPDHAQIFAKLEAFNPGGSVKDRLALAIINDARRRGTLEPGQTVVEATSGNTGIALAMACAATGHPFVAVMVETFSVERRKIMRALGARVILTPAAEKATGMVRKAAELAQRHGWFLASQFENPANPGFHRNTTAPEILTDFATRELDYFVAGWGTGGTITGIGEAIKAARPATRIVAAEPETASVLAGKAWGPHKLQGIVPDFMPAVMNTDVVDEAVAVSDEDAKAMSLRLAREEGIFVGLSAGAAVAAAVQVAGNAEPGVSILALLPDTGERYLSTWLFEELNEGPDNEWLEAVERRCRAAA